jgi:LysM repeat protein
MGKNRLMIALFLLIALTLTACTRAATSSNPDVDSQTEGEGGLPFPTSDFPPMDILETAAAATMTAQSGQPQVPAATTAPEVDAPQAATATPEPTAVAPTAVPTEEPSPTVETVACTSPYKVSAGEWVYSIARKCGLDPDEIISVNGLLFPFTLYPDDELQLPSGTDGTSGQTTSTATCPSPYMVKLGDWVFSIAQKCGSTAEAIVAANNLAFPYTIYPGDALTIP